MIFLGMVYMKNNNQDTKRFFGQFLKYFIPYKLQCIALLFVILLGLITSVLQPIFWSKIITSLFAQNMPDLIKILIMMVGLYVIMIIARVMQNIITAYLNKQVVYDMQNYYFERMLSMKMAYFDKTQNGTFIARIVTDITQAVDLVTNQIVPAIINLIKLIIILLIMLSISPVLTTITVLLMPITLFIYSKNIKKMREKQSEVKLSNDFVISMIQQAVAGIRSIKSLGLKEIETELFIKKNNSKTKKTYGYALFVIAFQTILSTIGMIGEISVYIVGAYLTFIAVISIERFIQFVSYSQQFGNSSLSLVNLVSDYQRIVVCLSRLEDMNDIKGVYHEKFGTKEITEVKGEIELENVSYGYDESSVLKNVNLKILPNQITAIVGKSGSGKTTLISLMTGLYQGENGNIRLNGVNIKELSEKSIRSYISVVSQQHFLFNASILDNFKYVNPDITLSEVKEICEQCEIRQLIESMPEKYDTVIYENGTNFSVGQLQRLCIARALAKNTPVIFFDEPTSSLDKGAAKKIRELIDRLKRNKTIVIISHDFEFIKDVDNIYKIENCNLIHV